MCSIPGKGTFFRKAREINALERISVEAVKKFYDAFLMPSSSCRRRLVCSLVGGAALSGMPADSPELLALRSSVPPGGADAEVEVRKKERGRAATQNGPMGTPRVVDTAAGPAWHAATTSERGPAGILADAGAAVPQTSGDCWPTFGATRGIQGSGQPARERSRGGRPRFINFTEGIGCTDPNCGGMC